MNKKFTAAGLTMAMLIAVFCGIAIPGKSVEAAPNTPANVYRVYNSTTGDHLLTASKAEYQRLVNVGLRGEGVVFYANGVGNDVYRLYNRKNGEHFYTVNMAEVNNCVRAGWKFEGVSFTTSGTNNVYRLCSPQGRHVFTSSQNERDYLWLSGWRYEGVAWKFSSTGSNSTPSYTPSTPTVTPSTPAVTPSTPTITPSSPTVVNPMVMRNSLSEMNAAAGTSIAKPTLTNVSGETFYTINSGTSTIAEYGFRALNQPFSLRSSAYNTTGDISGYYPAGGSINYSIGSDNIQYYSDSNVKLARFVISGKGQFVLMAKDNGMMAQTLFASVAQDFRNAISPSTPSPTYNNYSSLVGVYQDSYSQRASMYITHDGSQNVKIVIVWGNEANSTAQWRMTASYDSTGRLVYSDCVKTTIYADHDVQEYANGTGFFTVQNGKLLWNGASEASCVNCVFNRI